MSVHKFTSGRVLLEVIAVTMVFTDRLSDKRPRNVLRQRCARGVPRGVLARRARASRIGFPAGALSRRGGASMLIRQ